MAKCTVKQRIEKIQSKIADELVKGIKTTVDAKDKDRITKLYLKSIKDGSLISNDVLFEIVKNNKMYDPSERIEEDTLNKMAEIMDELIIVDRRVNPELLESTTASIQETDEVAKSKDVGSNKKISTSTTGGTSSVGASADMLEIITDPKNKEYNTYDNVLKRMASKIWDDKLKIKYVDTSTIIISAIDNSIPFASFFNGSIYIKNYKDVVTSFENNEYSQDDLRTIIRKYKTAEINKIKNMTKKRGSSVAKFNAYKRERLAKIKNIDENTDISKVVDRLKFLDRHAEENNILNHELIHSITAWYIDNQGSSDVSKELHSIFGYVKSKTKRKIKDGTVDPRLMNNIQSNGEPYWMQNAHEFMAEVFSKPDLMEAFNDMSDDRNKNNNISIAEAIYNLIVGALQKVIDTTVKEKSIASSTMKVLSSIVEEMMENPITIATNKSSSKVVGSSVGSSGKVSAKEIAALLKELKYCKA